MKRYIISFGLIAFFFCKGWAQRDYFYSEGQKIELIPIENREVVYASTQEKTVVNDGKYLRKGFISDKRCFFVREKEKTYRSSNQTRYPLLSAGNDTIVLLEKLITKVHPEFWTNKIWPYLERLDAKIVDTLAPYIYVIQMSNISTALATANYLFENGWVVWATPDYISLTATTTKWYNQYYIANYYDNMSKINPEIDKAWQITKGCSDIRVAVLDVGVEPHNDLRDKDGNSRVITGFDAFPNTEISDAHGTACAGIIAASHSEEMKGVAPNVKIVSVRIGWIGESGGFASASTIAKAIYWAFSSSGGNADILSNSWGGGSNQAVIQAIKDAQIYGRGGNVEIGTKGLGSVVVFASGNDRQYGMTNVTTYAMQAIAVGALTKEGVLTEYSQTGSGLDFVAFGGPEKGDIVTLDLMGSKGYTTGNYSSSFNGTSAACPQVSGIAALILSVNPSLSRDEVERIMINNAVDLGASGRDDKYGYGLVNGFKSVLEAVRTVSPLSLVTESGTLSRVNSPINVDFMPLLGVRGLASGLYKADIYKAEIKIPYRTDWVWLEGDGVSMASSTNEQTYIDVFHSNYDESTSAITYFFYVKTTRSGQDINKWYPCDPVIGNKFLYRMKLQENVEFNKVVHQSEQVNVTASQTIVLNPGFAVEEGGVFKATIEKEDINESSFSGCK